MKKLILYYLYGFLLIDTILRYVHGDIAGGFHPGLIIRGGISILLIHYFIKQNLLPGKINIFGVSAILFTMVCVLQIVVFNILSSDHVFEGYNSIRFSYKIVFMLLLANFVYTNADFFKSHTDRILYTNIIVFLVNCIGGYLFGVGFLSYKALADSYRGYLSGNNSSIMSFVSFGFLLYKVERRLVLNLILLMGTILTFYILGTNGFFIAVFMLLLFFISYLRRAKIKIVILVLLCFVSFGGLFSDIVVKGFEERIMRMYASKLARYDRDISDIFVNPIGVIAPVRSDLAKRHLSLQFSDSTIPIFLGYGYDGMYATVGRPAMMDILKIISFYGLLGFCSVYLCIFIVIYRIAVNFKLDYISVLIIGMFIYSSLGGFVLGASSMSTLFAFLLGIKHKDFLVDKKRRRKKIKATGFPRHELSILN
jgi:hypothetical protein